MRPTVGELINPNFNREDVHEQQLRLFREIGTSVVGEVAYIPFNVYVLPEYPLPPEPEVA